jgi:hypothetical protein
VCPFADGITDAVFAPLKGDEVTHLPSGERVVLAELDVAGDGSISYICARRGKFDGKFVTATNEQLSPMRSLVDVDAQVAAAKARIASAERLTGLNEVGANGAAVEKRSESAAATQHVRAPSTVMAKTGPSKRCSSQATAVSNKKARDCQSAQDLVSPSMYSMDWYSGGTCNANSETQGALGLANRCWVDAILCIMSFADLQWPSNVRLSDLAFDVRYIMQRNAEGAYNLELSKAADRIWHTLYENRLGTVTPFAHPPGQMGCPSVLTAALDEDLKGILPCLFSCQVESHSECECGTVSHSDTEASCAVVHADFDTDDVTVKAALAFASRYRKIVWTWDDESQAGAGARRCTGRCQNLPTCKHTLVEAPVLLRVTGRAGQPWDSSCTDTQYFYGHAYRFVGAAVFYGMHWTAIVLTPDQGLCYYNDMSDRGRLRRVETRDFAHYLRSSKTMFFTRVPNAPMCTEPVRTYYEIGGDRRRILIESDSESPMHSQIRIQAA